MCELNEKLRKLFKETSLETRIKVANEVAFINLIHELGYREIKMWTEIEDETLNKIFKLAENHTSTILKEIEKWKKDGAKIKDE